MSGRWRMRLPIAAVLAVLSGVAPAAQTSPPDPVRPVLERIEAALEADDLTLAHSLTLSAVKAHAADARVHNLAGVVAARRGDMAEAERSFRAAIAAERGFPDGYLNLGRLLQERAAADPAARGAALATYRALLAVAPDHVEATYQTAFLLALDGQFAESRSLANRLPDPARARPQVLALLAAVLNGEGQVAAAEAVAARLIAHPDLSFADVRAVMPAFLRAKHGTVLERLLGTLETRNQADAEMLRVLASLQARRGALPEARLTLERAAARGVTVPLLNELARVAYQQRDFEGALTYLGRARTMEPKNAGVHFFFGIVCVELNLAGEAYTSLKTAVGLAPENPAINYALGAVAMHRHEPSEALPYFEAYQRLAPRDPRGRFALGAAEFYAGQLDRARATLTAAASHADTAPGAHYYLARIARQLNDEDTAVREAREAIRLKPDYADAWAELGFIETRRGDFAAAQQALDRALALDPENHAANVNLTALYGRTRDPRREAQAARLADLQAKRAVQAQEFLRMVEVSPP